MAAVMAATALEIAVTAVTVLKGAVVMMGLSGCREVKIVPTGVPTGHKSWSIVVFDTACRDVGTNRHTRHI